MSAARRLFLCPGIGLGVIALLAGAISFAVASGQSVAAEIELLPDSPKEFPVISITGEMLPGDDKKFTALALDVDNAVVVFSSPGGDLLAGLGIGKTIRLKEFFTAVEDDAECASACGLAWLGGIKRFAHPNARIGFHAAYIESNGKATETGSGNALVGAYLNQLALPQSAVIFLTSAPPHDMQWLPLNEASAYGIDLEVLGPATQTATGDEIISALSGHTVEGSMLSSGDYAEFYDPDGVVRGADYEGSWRVSGDTMCFQYDDDEDEQCWQVRLDGDRLTWIRDGEEEGSGTIQLGNPNNF
jgi:hypothetical protein